MIIVAHPRFLQIHLFVATNFTQDERTSQRPLLLDDAVLEDLYKA
jgi:hypothetical protein